jgi:predicted dienelactone hydrolase
MKAPAFWLLFLYALAAPLRGEDGASYRVATAVFDWQDTKRDRAVPAKVYYPENKNTPSPVVIFSHGLGGSRDGYEYLGRYWASHGFVSVHVQHLGSDASVWQGSATPRQALKAAAMDVRNAAERPLDISFAIDQLSDLSDTPSERIPPCSSLVRH